MGERKGLTKYYPPDFDPSKLSRVKKPKDREISSHFMLPMSIRCLTCGEFMGAGLKFNAKKSTAEETYLGTKIFRFSMKCKACPASFIIKTDPEHSDYICETGAKRNFQPWRAAKEAEDEQQALRDEQDQDTIQALENKTLDAKEEMDELDALDELKASKALAARITTDELLARHRNLYDSLANAHGTLSDAQLDAVAKQAFAAKKTAIRRLDDHNGDRSMPEPGLPGTGSLPAEHHKELPSNSSGSAAPPKRTIGNGLVVIAKRKKVNPAEHVESIGPMEPPESAGLQSGIFTSLPGIGAYSTAGDDQSSSTSSP
jgi:Saf4/Yju2 protein